MVEENEEELAAQGLPVTATPEPETPEQEIRNVIAPQAAGDLKVADVVVKDLRSAAKRVEDFFEWLREDLVRVLGDIPGVHKTVDDAKAAIAEHVPAEEIKEEK